KTVAEQANVVPGPPEGARDAEVVAQEPRSGSRPLRRPLFWLALVLIAAEGTRRILTQDTANGPSSARDSRDSSADSESVLSSAALRANGSATDIGRALDEAATLIHLSGGGTILLVSDGNDLAGGGLAAARAASKRGVPVEVWPLASPSEPELAVEGVAVPVG